MTLHYLQLTGTPWLNIAELRALAKISKSSQCGDFFRLQLVPGGTNSTTSRPRKLQLALSELALTL